MLNIVVLISGSGSNLQAILDHIASGKLNARVVGVLSNRADAYGLVRAQAQHIPTAVVSHHDFNDRESFDNVMMSHIDTWSPDVVVLAGFMRILSEKFVTHYHGRLLNIHPSLLPKHKGLHTHRRALEAGDSEHGCSVHFVTAELDGGPVIAQAPIAVLANDTEDSLRERVHKNEHQLYSQVLIWLANGDLVWQNNTVYFQSQPLREPLLLRETHV